MAGKKTFQHVNVAMTSFKQSQYPHECQHAEQF